MNLFKKNFNKAKNWIKNAPNKKHHLDFLIAILSIPVLILAVTTNIINLQNRNKATPTPSPVQVNEKPVIIERPLQKPSGAITEVSPTQTPVCIKKVGPISIDSPSEGQVIKDNPVCITISYDNSNYCSVVWSYRINGGDWSNYTNNSPCLYNFPKGQVKFDLKVQSTVAQDQTATLTRNFDYEGGSGSTATPSASANQ